MKQSLYEKIVVVSGVFILFSNIPKAYNVLTGAFEPSPYLWVVMFALLSVPILIKRHFRLDIIKSPLVVWCFGFLWVTMAWFVPSAQSEVMWQDVRWRWLAVVNLLTWFLLLSNEADLKLSRKAVLVATLLAVALNIYELFFPGTFSKVHGRAAGLQGDPNQSAEAIVLGTLFSVTLLPWWLRGPFLMLVGIGTLLTFSRSGMAEWVIVVGGFIFFREVSIKPLLLSCLVGIILATGVMLFMGDQVLTSWDNLLNSSKDIGDRLGWILNPGSVADQSGLGRQQLARMAWERFNEYPLLGRGTGASTEAYIGTHNAYLGLMEDHGLLGAAIVPLLVLAVTWGAVGEARMIAMIFVCAVLWQSFFSHGILYTEARTLSFAMMAAMVWIYGKEGGSRTMTVDTERSPETKALARA